MSRYIDADKLAMHLADYQYSIPYGCIDESAEDMGAYMAVGECLKAIDEQPTIDIVRCSECRYCKKKRGTFKYRKATMIKLRELAEIADRLDAEHRGCDNCGTPRDKCVYCIEEDKMWTPQTERSE